MFGNKDTDRIILDELDDKTLMYICNVNRYFRERVCDETFFRNIIYNKYPEIVDKKKKDETWKELFLRKNEITKNNTEKKESTKKKTFLKRRTISNMWRKGMGTI